MTETRTQTSRNNRLAAVRLALHGLICTGATGRNDYCTGDGAKDHARRTQHGRAVAIVDAQYPTTAIITALHELAHPTCETAADEDHFRVPAEHPAYLAVARAAELPDDEPTWEPSYGEDYDGADDER